MQIARPGLDGAAQQLLHEPDDHGIANQLEQHRIAAQQEIAIAIDETNRRQGVFLERRGEELFVRLFGAFLTRLRLIPEGRAREKCRVVLRQG